MTDLFSLIPSIASRNLTKALDQTPASLEGIQYLHMRFRLAVIKAQTEKSLPWPECGA